MTVRSKQDLRNLFKTGDVPTGQNFTDFIDSYIASVNGVTPNTNGEIDVPLNYIVMQQMNVDVQPREFSPGNTVAIQPYVPGNDPNGWHTILPAEVEAGEIFIQTIRFPQQDITIQQIDTNRDGLFFNNISRVSLANGTWSTVTSSPFIRSINGVTTPYNGEIVLPEVPKAASVFYRSASNQTVLLDNTTMIFNGKDNNQISVTVNPDNGVFTLNPTKKYSFQVNPVIQFISGATNVDYSMFSYNEGQFQQITSQRGFVSNDGSTGTGSAQSGSFIVNGATHPQVAIRAVSIGGTSETRGFGLLNIYSHVLVQEL